MTPALFMLIGAPGTGKSTWVSNQQLDWSRTVLVSSDGHIEEYAKSQGRTYSDVFKEYMGTATQLMMNDITDAINKDYDIIWDQTNMSAKARKRKLQAIPLHYEKYALVFELPDETEHARRLASRPGKNISPDIINNMVKSFNMPTTDEGFDQIITINNE
jgi:predicted kinase